MNGSLQPSSRWGRQDQAFQVSQAILADVSGPELPPHTPVLYSGGCATSVSSGV